jgi:hypothetical protein
MTKTLNQLYQEHRDNQLSPILLSLLREPVDVTINTFTRIATILQLIDAIEKLGWTEHTSDWDLGATITLKSGKQIGVLQGYAGNLYLGYKNYIQLSLKTIIYQNYPNTIQFTYISMDLIPRTT